MIEYILKNTCDWILYARIVFIPAMNSYVLNVQTTRNRRGFVERFETLRGAKIYFTKNYKKGNWETINDELV